MARPIRKLPIWLTLTLPLLIAGCSSSEPAASEAAPDVDPSSIWFFGDGAFLPGRWWSSITSVSQGLLFSSPVGSMANIMSSAVFSLLGLAWAFSGVFGSLADVAFGGLFEWAIERPFASLLIVFVAIAQVAAIIGLFFSVATKGAHGFARSGDVQRIGLGVAAVAVLCLVSTPFSIAYVPGGEAITTADLVDANQALTEPFKESVSSIVGEVGQVMITPLDEKADRAADLTAADSCLQIEQAVTPIGGAEATNMSIAFDNVFRGTFLTMGQRQFLSTSTLGREVRCIAFEANRLRESGSGSFGADLWDYVSAGGLPDSAFGRLGDGTPILFRSSDDESVRRILVFFAACRWSGSGWVTSDAFDGYGAYYEQVDGAWQLNRDYQWRDEFCAHAAATGDTRDGPLAQSEEDSQGGNGWFGIPNPIDDLAGDLEQAVNDLINEINIFAVDSWTPFSATASESDLTKVSVLAPEAGQFMLTISGQSASWVDVAMTSIVSVLMWLVAMLLMGTIWIADLIVKIIILSMTASACSALTLTAWGKRDEQPGYALLSWVDARLNIAIAEIFVLSAGTVLGVIMVSASNAGLWAMDLLGPAGLIGGANVLLFAIVFLVTLLALAAAVMLGVQRVPSSRGGNAIKAAVNPMSAVRTAWRAKSNVASGASGSSSGGVVSSLLGGGGLRGMAKAVQYSAASAVGYQVGSATKDMVSKKLRTDPLAESHGLSQRNGAPSLRSLGRKVASPVVKSLAPEQAAKKAHEEAGERAKQAEVRRKAANGKAALMRSWKGAFASGDSRAATDAWTDVIAHMDRSGNPAIRRAFGDEYKKMSPEARRKRYSQIAETLTLNEGQPLTDRQLDTGKLDPAAIEIYGSTVDWLDDASESWGEEETAARNEWTTANARLNAFNFDTKEAHSLYNKLDAPGVELDDNEKSRLKKIERRNVLNVSNNPPPPVPPPKAVVRDVQLSLGLDVPPAPRKGDAVVLKAGPSKKFSDEVKASRNVRRIKKKEE